MSTRTRPASAERPALSVPRMLALGGGLVLTGSYVAVLFEVTSVVGDSQLLLWVAAAALALATLLAQVLRPRVAAVVGAVLFAAGVVAYVSAVPLGWYLMLNLGSIFVDVLALLSGVSLLRMTEVGTWAVGFVPAPVFLSWYLLMRRRYGLGVAVGGATLLSFALTGDAGSTVTLAGVVGATAAVGFGEADLRRGTGAEMEIVTAVLAVMVVTAASVAVLPAGEANPFFPEDRTRTIEGSLVNADDRISVVGSIELTPQVRFVVESDEPAYWRTNAFDRYTGEGWVRSGGKRTIDGRLPGPPGRSEQITQTINVESSVGVMPAAWRPVGVSRNVRDQTRVTSMGGFEPTGPLTAGESYTVISERPVASEEELRNAGTDYPEEILNRYTQLPESTSDRLAEFTSDLTADADNPYEAAKTIERWLEENKGYSLDVTRPSGDIADSFVFGMDEGYCVYFATAMVTMLRTQDVPARFVVGYGEGQRVAEDRWVVRGLDSHAWVEVYFPNVGWVTFDPTPSGPRGDARQDAVEDARERGEEGIDAAGSENGEWTPTPDPQDPGETPTPSDPGATPSTTGTPPGGQFGVPMDEYEAPDDDGGGGLPRELIGFGVVVIVGLAAGARRTNAVDRAQWVATVLWQRGRRDPATDVQRAYDRLEYVLGRRYRPRRTGETRSQYVRTIDSLERDERIRRVGKLAIRARYGGDVTAEEADEAVELVDDLVREQTPGLRRLRGGR